MSIEQEARAVRLDHLLGVYRVGSRDWSWHDEYDDLIHRPVTQQLLAAVKRDGITEPILLGTDGRVWDGHHRITVAMHLGLDSVPVEFAGSSRPATRETVTEEMVERAARALYEATRGGWEAWEEGPFPEWQQFADKDEYRRDARLVLEAATDAHRCHVPGGQ